MKNILLPLLLCPLVTLIFTPAALGKEAAVKKAPVGTKLTDLEPVETEYGTYEYPDASLRETVQQKGHGPMVFDTGAYHSGNQHWPDARKIIKEVIKSEKITAENYRSKVPDVFFAGRDQITGVGLWVQVHSMYHFLEYQIPEGSKTFQASLYRTDDSKGYMNDMPGGPDAYNGWYEVTLKVLVDGKEVWKNNYKEVNVAMGTGNMLEELDIPIPMGAKKIKFLLESSGALDWNKNVELVLSEGLFKK